MYVLVPEVSSAPARRAVEALAAAGHVVRTCRGPAETARTCIALRGAPCPLERDPIDVALAVRSAPSADPLPHEDGILCAIRRKVPVVVSGDIAAESSPSAWAGTCSGYDVVQTVETVERVAETPLPLHSRLATYALQASLARAKVDVRNARTEVFRRQGRLHAVAKVAPRPPVRAAQAASVRIEGALAELDPHVRGIDVVVTGVSE